jgi:hypothetical protein
VDQPTFGHVRTDRVGGPWASLADEPMVRLFAHFRSSPRASAARRTYFAGSKHPSQKEASVMSLRGLRLLVIPAIVATGFSLSSGIALADDDAYLAQMSKLGFTGDKDTMIALGHAICADRSMGETPDQLAKVVQTKFTNATYQDATAAVSAAESAYCP